MTIDNLATLKDDMIAFIEGHGMRYFPAVIPEGTPRVWWSDPEPTLSIVENIKESWKDFVEMAKTAGAPLVCIGEDTLDKTMVELLVSELQEISGGDAFRTELEKVNSLLSQVGKVGHVELAFAHQGVLFVHETATDWYIHYRQIVDTIDHLQEILEEGLDDDFDEDDDEDEV